DPFAGDSAASRARNAAPGNSRRSWTSVPSSSRPSEPAPARIRSANLFAMDRSRTIAPVPASLPVRLLLALAAGCSTESYVADADREVGAILDAGRTQTLGDREQRVIRPQPEKPPEPAPVPAPTEPQPNAPPGNAPAPAPAPAPQAQKVDL